MMLARVAAISIKTKAISFGSAHRFVLNNNFSDPFEAAEKVGYIQGEIDHYVVIRPRIIATAYCYRVWLGDRCAIRQTTVRYETWRPEGPQQVI